VRSCTIKLAWASTIIATPNIARHSDANIPFDDLCQLLRRLGVEERIRSSHQLFRKEGVGEKINLQREGSKAKVY
jgi:hypothetical protein